MSVRETTGVRGLARILSSLSDGRTRSVAELVLEESLSRSTAFDLVRRLLEARLLARGPTGKLTIGPRFIEFGFNRFGLARLHGPAEAILRWLRDHCDATVKLTCADGDERLTLAASFSEWARLGATDRPATVSLGICGENGAEVARLDLICRQNSSRPERTEIEKLALRAKASLEHHLRGDTMNLNLDLSSN